MKVKTLAKRKWKKRRTNRGDSLKVGPEKLVMIGFLLVGAAIYFNWDSSKTSQPIADDETLRLGEAVFQQNCAVCHGENGEGHAALAQAPALNESEHAWHHPDGQLQEIIQNGGVEMPSFEETLENDEIKAVIRYFQTFWRPDQLQVQQANSTQYPFR